MTRVRRRRIHRLGVEIARGGAPAVIRVRQAERDALLQQIAAEDARRATDRATPTGTDGTNHRSGSDTPPERSGDTP